MDHERTDPLLDIPHTAQVTADRDEDGNISRITVDVSPYAPTGPGSTLADLVDSGTLETWISGAACGNALPQHQRNFGAVMLGTAALIDQAQEQQKLSALVARDRSGWSWRKIATHAGVHHRTVERQVTALRWDMAEQGVWIDALGVHDGGHGDKTFRSRNMTNENRTTFALVMAHYRETAPWPVEPGGTGAVPVEITPPITLDTSKITFATVHPRHADIEPYPLWITRPVRLVGGPRDGATHVARAGDRGWFPEVEPDTPGAGRHAYRPAEDTPADVWMYEGVEL